jgi:hypothetical protein
VSRNLRSQRPSWAACLSLLVLVLLPASTSAALGPEAHLDGAYRSQGRYHGAKSGQYQLKQAQKGSFSKYGWEYKQRYSRQKYVDRINPLVISRKRLNLDQEVSTAVSRFPSRKSRWVSPRVRADSGTEKASISRSAVPQTHQRNETRLMIEIGQLLGLAYLAFLVLWFWTTRVRRRPLV